MRRGDLITVALQGEHGKPRPALVIQSDLFAQLTSTVTVALLTSTALDVPLIRVPVEPSERNGLRKRSYVMIDQIFSAATRRFGGTDQNAAIHLYTHERACPEARSARGRGVSNNARARQRPWISAVSARADSRAA